MIASFPTVADVCEDAARYATPSCGHRMHPDGLALIALALYLGATAPAAITLAGRWPERPSPRIIALSAATVAVILHLVLLSAAMRSDGGITLGIGSAVSLFGWQVAVILLFAELRWPVSHLGLLVWPLAGLTVLATGLGPDVRPATSVIGWPLGSHVILSMMAYGLLALAALQAILYAIQDHQLRRQGQLARIWRLPLLEQMERLLFLALGAGFVALTLALITGSIFVENLLAQHLVHKTVLSSAAWMVIGTLVWGRWRQGWRGRRAVKFALGGFLVLALAYFGSKFVLEVILGRHWG